MGPPEVVLVVLRGIGASLFLTNQNLIFVRDGAHRRPRKGHRALTIDALQHIEIEFESGPSGRIVVWTTDGREAVSMFFDARSLDRAHELVDIARPLIARSRRGPSDTEPAS